MGIEVEPMGNSAYWFSLPGLLSYLSYVAQAHLPRNGTAHSGLGSQQLRKCLTGMVIEQSNGDSSLAGFLSS